MSGPIRFMILAIVIGIKKSRICLFRKKVVLRSIHHTELAKLYSQKVISRVVCPADHCFACHRSFLFFVVSAAGYFCKSVFSAHIFPSERVSSPAQSCRFNEWCSLGREARSTRPF